MNDSLRKDLEAAIAAEEKASAEAPVEITAAAPIEPAEIKPTEPAPAPPEAKDTEPTEPAPTEAAAPADTASEAKATETQEPVEPPPQSWKPALKAKWGSLDPELRQEIIRRERDILREFGVSSTARKIANDLQEVVQPYEARMRALNVSPLQAVGELLKADYLLSSAQPSQKAQFMAKMIKDYGVDINELDNALAGTMPDPATAKVEQLLQQQLAPMQQFIQQQQAAAAAQEQARQQAAIEEIQRMAADHVKYPYFETVRNDMADIIDLMAKRGVQLTPAEAYARAVLINPETAPLVRAQSQQVQQVQTQNQRAQKAIQASASVKGAPVGTPATKVGDSLRDTIEAAFSQIEGR